MPPHDAETAELWQVPSLEEARRAAIRDVWAAFWASRAIVWIAGIAAVLYFGSFPETSARLDPLYTTLPFDDELANLLAAPSARFDSAWYLTISEHGYDGSGRPAFFPLFPVLTSALAPVFGSSLLAGVAISSASAVGAMYLLHRLVTTEFGPRAARTTVWIVALFPSALVLSAVYTESLFLLLSVGALYSGRLGRWPLAAILAGLAASSRSGGLLLMVPLLVLYLYGPRADGQARLVAGWRPRYPVRADILWILLAVPAGLALCIAYLGMATGDPLAMFSAQDLWHRHFLPLGGLVLGAWSAISGAAELVLPGLSRPPASVGNGIDATVLIVRDIALFGFLVAAVWLVRECARRLPPAYTAYALVGLALPLSLPASGHALMSLPRFMFVLFPLWIALALWALERDRVRPVLAVLAAMLVVSTTLFTTWSWAP